MKTMLVVFALTLVFIVSMCFIENKRQQELNRINLEYKQGLALLGLTDDSSSYSSIDYDPYKDDNDDEEDEILTCTIEGAVNYEGEYEIESGVYLSELINMAGGLTAEADNRGFNMYYTITDEGSYYIPITNDNEKISINSATISDFDKLPGIGETIATRIYNYREENGNFKCIDELKNVKGIGTSAFKKIRDYIIL